MSIRSRPRDKMAVGAVLGLLSLVAWVSLLFQSRSPLAPFDMMMGSGLTDAMAEPMGVGFSVPELLAFLGGWVVMMAAMMLPSASPMVATYAAVARNRDPRRGGYWSTGLFVLGYLVAWGAFGLAAYAASVLAATLAMALPVVQAHLAYVGAAVLVLTGVYQFSPLKDRCFSSCRTPLGFLLTHWRGGGPGAVRMGVDHGLYCVGCCWALMAVLFVAGVMNLAWMALLALLVCLEKVASRGPLVGKAAGLLLVLGGVAVAAGTAP